MALTALPPKRRSKLLARVAVGLPAFSLVIWAEWLHVRAFQFIILVASYFAATEVFDGCIPPQLKPAPDAAPALHQAYNRYLAAKSVSVILTLGLITLAGATPQPLPFWDIALWGLLPAIWLFSTTAAPSWRLGIVAVGSASYTAGLAGCLIVIRALPQGQSLALAVILMVVAADVFALAGGITLGRLPYLRHCLTPVISPNKTVAGHLTGWIAAVTVGLVMHQSLAEAHLGWWLGAIIGLIAELGDLLSSVLKRQLRIKDWSGLLPGHGGLQDRLDSVGVSAFVALTLLGLIGTAPF